MAKKQHTPQSALESLQRLCSQSEKCIYDVRLKLIAWGISTSDAAKIVDKLVGDRFIDEQRYALAYVREKLNLSKWGIQKITSMLKAKQIPPSTIAFALEEVNPDSYKNDLLEILERKNRLVKAASSNERKAKLIRFALSRGYEYPLVCTVVNQLLSLDQEFD